MLSTCSSYTHFTYSVHLYSNADKNQIIYQKSHTHTTRKKKLRGITTDDEVEARLKAGTPFLRFASPHTLLATSVQPEKSDVQLYIQYVSTYFSLFLLSFILFFFLFFFLLYSSLYLHISPSFPSFLWNTFTLLQNTNKAWQYAMEHTHTHRHLPFDLQVSRTMGYLLPTSTRLFPENENLCLFVSEFSDAYLVGCK